MKPLADDTYLSDLAQVISAMTHIPWQDVAVQIERGVKEHGNIVVFGSHIFSMDCERIFQDYAAKLGKDELDSTEKQVAAFNYVIEQGKVSYEE